jgi:hypothetical protein
MNSEKTTSEIQENKKTTVFDKFTGFFKRSDSNNKVNITENTVNTSQSSTKGSPTGPSLKEKVIDKLDSWIKVEKSYLAFFVLLFLGMGLLFFCLFFIFSPHKFMLCCSLGSIMILTSFLFLKGTRGFLVTLLSPKRIWFSLLFVVSIVVGLSFAIGGSFIFALIFAAGQALCLVVFILSFVPGGQNGIKFIGRKLLSPFGFFFRARSYLPI